MILAISGKINAGKDLVGNIIAQFLNEGYIDIVIEKTTFSYYPDNLKPVKVKTEIKKFGWAIKQICAIILNCKPEDFEDREFKNMKLSSDWDYFHIDGKISDNGYEKHRKHLTPRDILQKIGTEGSRNSVHPNIWVNVLIGQYKKEVQQFGTYKNDDREDPMMIKSHPNWIITDLRFPNEAKAIKEAGGLVVRINRPTIQLDDMREHESERALDDYKEWNYVLENDGDLEQLFLQIIKMIDFLKLTKKFS